MSLSPPIRPRDGDVLSAAIFDALDTRGPNLVFLTGSEGAPFDGLVARAERACRRDRRLAVVAGRFLLGGEFRARPTERPETTEVVKLVRSVADVVGWPLPSLVQLLVEIASIAGDARDLLDAWSDTGSTGAEPPLSRLIATTAEAPTLFLLGAAENMDDLVLTELCETLPAALDGRPVAVVLHGVGDKGLLARYAVDRAAAGAARAVVIAPHTADEIAEWCDCSPALARDLEEVTAGAAGRLVDAVAELERFGWATRRADGSLDRRSGPPPSDDVRSFLHQGAMSRAFGSETGERRMRALRLLQAAALVGTEFLSEPLHALSGYSDEEACRTDLDAFFADRGVVVSRLDTAGITRADGSRTLVVPYRFTSALWRSLFRASMAGVERRGLASDVSDALLAFHPGPPFAVAAIVVSLMREAGRPPDADLSIRAARATTTADRRNRLAFWTRLVSDQLTPRTSAVAPYEIEMLCRDLYGAVDPGVLISALRAGDVLAMALENPLQALACRALTLPNMVRVVRLDPPGTHVTWSDVKDVGQAVMTDPLFSQLDSMAIGEALNSVSIALEDLEHGGREFMLRQRGRWGARVDLTIDQNEASFMHFEGRLDDARRLAERNLQGWTSTGSKVTPSQRTRGFILLRLAGIAATAGDWILSERRAQESDEALLAGGDVQVSLSALEAQAAARHRRRVDFAALRQEAMARSSALGHAEPPAWAAGRAVPESE